MKNTIIILILFIGLISCKSQTTASLKQMEDCRKRPDRGVEPCPGMENITHVKDVGNRLDRFVGIWKGNYGGKQYEIVLEKKLDFGDNGVKWDLLIGKVKIKNNQNQIIFDNFSTQNTDANPNGINFQGTTYEMYFVGNYNCYESGSVFINTVPLDLNNLNNSAHEMTLFYVPDTDVLITNPNQCPNYNNFIPLFPKEKMTLTKQ